MIEHIKRRMMTWLTGIASVVAYLESQGHEVFATIGALLSQGEAIGALIFGAAAAGLAGVQEYMNRKK